MIAAASLPDHALLRRYADRADCFTDCYVADIGRPVELGTYLCAFYATWVFAPEKALLRVVLGRPARDFDVMPLALGESDRFAAWDVEERAEGQVLLCDLSGRTRSWFMVDGTQVYFGSAVVPPYEGADLGRVFRALLGFHHVYSRALLRAAVARLRAMSR
ncbi:hypothetical protein SAMN04488515_1755 [Cognatiyoonia koreensis]|uniref:DUF2867 domain-containing protein n=1 Tax=Cognatiyoonia koreensis TaxID=364200 RepID=A0A1I0Q8X0_9RHOB|nr:hypothetical protein [Cognatiyoonia koreensis]SEW23472.1 hypothetical protein SAMN04488515_1755 [Cognatiyoonia koreensis]